MVKAPRRNQFCRDTRTSDLSLARRPVDGIRLHERIERGDAAESRRRATRSKRGGGKRQTCKRPSRKIRTRFLGMSPHGETANPHEGELAKTLFVVNSEPAHRPAQTRRCVHFRLITTHPAKKRPLASTFVLVLRISPPAPTDGPMFLIRLANMPGAISTALFSLPVAADLTSSPRTRSWPRV